MNCQNCNENINPMKFRNLGLTYQCPKCKKRTTFNPSIFAIFAIFIFSYFVWMFIPVLHNIIFDIILSLSIGLIIVFLGFTIVLKFNLGKYVLID